MSTNLNFTGEHPGMADATSVTLWCFADASVTPLGGWSRSYLDSLTETTLDQAHLLVIEPFPLPYQSGVSLGFASIGTSDTTAVDEAGSADIDVIVDWAFPPPLPD